MKSRLKRYRCKSILNISMFIFYHGLRCFHSGSSDNKNTPEHMNTWDFVNTPSKICDKRKYRFHKFEDQNSYTKSVIMQKQISQFWRPNVQLNIHQQPQVALKPDTDFAKAKTRPSGIKWMCINTNTNTNIRYKDKNTIWNRSTMKRIMGKAKTLGRRWTWPHIFSSYSLLDS